MSEFDPFNTIIGKHMFPELDQSFEQWNKLYQDGFTNISNITNFIELYQKLCELTPEEISKFIEKFEEIRKGLK